MDIYTNPSKRTYVTGITKFFLMPTNSGGIPAVAVSKRASVYISSTYTILMILIFMVGWKLILAVIMAYWPTNHDPNRETALVALWNSGESMNAAFLMGAYCKGMINHLIGRKKDSKKSKKATSNGPAEGGVTTDESQKTNTGGELTATGEQSDSEKQSGVQGVLPADPPAPKAMSAGSNLWWGILFLLTAAAMTAGNIISGILVPVELSMGNLVPPNKDAIFYPNVKVYIRTDDNGAGIAKLNSLKAPSALRAIGSIEASGVTVRNRVFLERITPPDDRQSAGLNYHYNVTGVDMGLQSDPKLVLRVKGSCRTDSTWLVAKPNSTDQGDTYKLFGKEDNLFNLTRSTAVGFPPMVTFFLDEEANAHSGSNTSYAMIIDSAGHYSYGSGQDPWYFTEKSPPNARIAYQVAGGRPPLSCWETRNWHLNGKEVEAVALSTLPGLNLHKLWAEDVLPLEFAQPRLITLGRAAGPAALKSASYTMAPDFILDAGASNILDDLERLVLASWVSSRNVLTDTTTYEPGTMENLAKSGGGAVEAGAAKFVLQSGDVDTLSVRILIAVPAILLFLHVVEWILYCVLRRSHHGKEPILPEPYGKKNVMDLLATHLYKELYKKIGYKEPWEYEDSDVPLLFPPGSEESTMEHGKIQIGK